MSDARYAVDRRPAIVWSEGLRLAADILTPSRLEGPAPAILLCHGWGGRKQHLLELYAPHFAAAGYVVMVFDYRTWGESDGKPVPVAGEPMLTEAGERTIRVRVIGEVVDPVDHVTDVRAALAYLLAEPGVDPDRVGLFGTSYGGGHVLAVAGTDDRVRAVVAQIGGYGHPTSSEFRQRARQQAADKARGVLDPPIPQDRGGAVTSLGGVPDLARQLTHSPLELARGVRVPTLFIDAEFEEYNTEDPQLQGGGAFEVVRQNAVSERHTFPCTHYRVYDEYLEPARKLALDWFEKYL
ncbi:MAG TPA: alpha/beta fold hydrolase [Streptosporangiaceae bacterium]|nr:alpha/beta fold hydrolase [Streptosporangiaceae bacterium]